MNRLKKDPLKTLLRNGMVTVMGLGQSGISAALSLVKLGVRPFLSEQKPRNKMIKNIPGVLRSLKSEFGGHSTAVLQSSLIIISPGIHLDIPILKSARKKNIPIMNELELGWKWNRFKKTAAITGTNGKTTTASLLNDMCRRDGKNVALAGNIGKPLSGYPLLRKRADTAVLEVSSYQLESCKDFRPTVSAVLNLTPDHIHRHRNMTRYAAVKARIFKNQDAGDVTVLNAMDPWCRKMSRSCRSKIVWFSSSKLLRHGVFFDFINNRIIARIPSVKRNLEFMPPKHLIGLHNIENSCAAVACALSMGIKPTAVERALLNFKGVPHRLESAGILNHVAYINDSKSTNVASTLKALESFTQSVWLILGGQDKGTSYNPLKREIKQKVKGVFLIGESSEKIYHDLKGSCDLFFCKTLKRAFQESFIRSASGDTVLLSPACASFDQFSNFEDRGNQFKAMIKTKAKTS